ncbi:NAD(P)H-dependent oxidoreductase [Dendronalium sp. ChiSLP03b]|uniref:NADPH-dependent FMN reductase n=1 Tax=Dendronalium sp. ChiSLP03b TaxID=3075381 RepID=UPI002AD220B7|nr:NAD(P)H-dependent oxidoreductase [Dendronalium sp. ChiSLP03b]MDZ8206730.1 NAD(P)H-dependent oxidoreductase [Dendronalium sp. ChiSLP03b]
MKILAISGSLRPGSANTSLLRAAARIIGEGIELTIYEGLANLPHFNPELDGEVPPISVNNWRKQLRKSDGVIICTPEYAYGMPGVLKNALDWIVSSGELVGKPVAAISASPSEFGGANAHASLVLTLTALAANIVLGASLSVPFVSKKLNNKGELTDPDTAQLLRFVLDALVAAMKVQPDAAERLL